MAIKKTTKKQQKTVRVNTRITKEQHDWLQYQSEMTSLSQSTIMMLALQEYINNQKLI